MNRILKTDQIENGNSCKLVYNRDHEGECTPIYGEEGCYTREGPEGPYFDMENYIFRSKFGDDSVPVEPFPSHYSAKHRQAHWENPLQWADVLMRYIYEYSLLHGKNSIVDLRNRLKG